MNTKKDRIGICNQILDICRDDAKEYKAHKEILYRLGDELRGTRDLTFESLTVILDMAKELFLLKNRKASYIEHDLLRLTINGMPASIAFGIQEERTEYELKTSYQENAPIYYKLHSLLLKFAFDVLQMERDKSKRASKRISETLQIITNLSHMYEIEESYGVYERFIKDKDEDVQFFALCGLEEYYAYESARPITKTLIQRLDKIIKTAKLRTTVVSALNIKVNANKINEFSALDSLDDWKEENLYN